MINTPFQFSGNNRANGWTGEAGMRTTRNTLPPVACIVFQFVIFVSGVFVFAFLVIHSGWQSAWGPCCHSLEEWYVTWDLWQLHYNFSCLRKNIIICQQLFRYCLPSKRKRKHYVSCNYVHVGSSINCACNSRQRRGPGRLARTYSSPRPRLQDFRPTKVRVSPKRAQ